LKNISIIVVPTASDFQKLKTLVLPTDYTRKHEKFELLPVMELSKLWNTAIQVIHFGEEFLLTDVQKTNIKILEERLAGSNYSLYKLGMETNIAKSIEQYVNDIRADLLAMVRYRHTFWENIIGEPVIKK